MPFDTFDAWNKNIAEKALTFCRKQYGSNGLKCESPIDSSISWRPTFFLKPASHLIIGVEVNDVLYPEALKAAAHDIGHYDSPVAIYQACSLDAYQRDKDQSRINLLRTHGFGIITVAEDGAVSIQNVATPLAQHISISSLDSEMTSLNSSLKIKFKAAHTTYAVNVGQGLQEAGQIVEALIHSIAKQAGDAGLVIRGIEKKPLAVVIDILYEKFTNHRAALGDARGFVNEFRNTASHAPKSAKQAALKIRNCRKGFINSVTVSSKLFDVMKQLDFKLKIYTT
jgi:hypothetical protein